MGLPESLHDSGIQNSFPGVPKPGIWGSHGSFEEDASGTFVQLRLGLAQTTCRKRAPQRHCRVLESRRKPTCLACYKFDNSDVPKVLDKYHNCGPSHHLTAKEIRQRDEAECRAVEEAGKGGDIVYLPGMFAFSRGLPA
ncbi:retinoic acid receptor responder protein 2 isoform 2-T2 [Acridotheres tristis]